MSEQTLRRHLAALIEAGLLVRKDSANGKRYAHKRRNGEISEAFGFSLAPLLARACEIECLAAHVVAERIHLKRLRERLTVCRRDITKLIETGVNGQIDHDWQAMTEMSKSTLARLSRSPTVVQVEDALEALVLLRAGVLNVLETPINVKRLSGNADQNERHIQITESESISESEPAEETTLRSVAGNHQGPSANPPEEGRSDRPNPNYLNGVQPFVTPTMVNQRQNRFPLALVLQACPQIIDYGPGGGIATWRDLMKSAVVVRTMLGISPSAFADACSLLGPENAATVVACILERGEHINSAGGYLRDLTRRTEKHAFAVGPMLMALLRLNGRQLSGVDENGFSNAGIAP